MLLGSTQKMALNRPLSIYVNGKLSVPVNGAGLFPSGGSQFPQSLFSGGYNGIIYDTTVASSLWQDTAATTQASAGTVLQRVDNQLSSSYPAIEATSPPYFRTGSATCVGAYTLTIDFNVPTVDPPTTLGTDCTIGIAYPNGGTEILWHQNIGSTYTISVPFSAMVIINRAVTTAEAVSLRTWLTARCGISESNLWFGVQGVGQSLILGTNTNAAGNAGELVDSTNHDSRAHMFTITGGSADYGPRPFMDSLPANNNTSIDTSKLTGVELLTEGINDVAGGKYGETPMTGFISQFLKNDSYAAQFICDIHGRGGTQYQLTGGAGLAPDTVHFNNGQILQDLERDSVEAASGKYRLLTLLNMHGEADAAAGRGQANYSSDMQDWVNQYNLHRRDGVRTLRPVPMVYSQISNMNPAGAFAIALGQRDAAAADSRLLLTGPKYMITYSDGTHIRSTSERIMGEVYGKVLRRVLKEGVTWVPLKIRDANRVGAVVTVRFWVPVPPLVIDTTLVSSIANNGFEYTDDVGTVTISSVSLTPATTDSVDVTLSSSSLGANPKLRLAKTQSSTSNTGPTLGARTNFRDSDTELGVLTGTHLYNWAIHDEVLLT